MILSRAKPAIAGDKDEAKEGRGSAKKQIPTIEEFLSKRDYTGINYYLYFNGNVLNETVSLLIVIIIFFIVDCRCHGGPRI